MRWKVSTALLMLVTLLASTLISPAQPAAAAPIAAPAAAWEPFRYFPETGHNIGLGIKAYYDRYGGLPVFGYPLTEEFDELNTDINKTLRTQYFERNRLEMHPQNKPPYNILLGRLGAEMLERNGIDWGALPKADPSTPNYFAETGQAIAPEFYTFWATHGIELDGRAGYVRGESLALFGLPLTPAQLETNSSGHTVLTQWFERARFEYHPQNADPNWRVQLGLLGGELARVNDLPESVTAPVRAIVNLGEATTGYGGSAAERVNNIARAASRFNGVVVKPGETFSFLKYVGDMSAEDGFTEGYAIVNGRLEKVIGGGVCQVSTTLYRAVFRAGFPVVERVPHSNVVYFYENIHGFDATVFSPYTDFRWKNDLNSEVYIYSETNVNAGTVTFSLWGYSDGRKVEMVGPYTKNETKPGVPVWQYDPTLGYGAVVQMVHGRGGLDVDMWRNVYSANGTRIRQDYFFSRYQPWDDFYLYGAGVTPPAGAKVIPPSSTNTAKFNHDY